MKLTRNGHIKMAATEYAIDVQKKDKFTTVSYDFEQGARWADANQPQSYEAFREETDEIIMKLQDKLAKALKKGVRK